ncbi:MAG: hypothetical protein GY928_21235 [Colwellia sp.]|nr:hypothetical protein [Colwellia sp.]
MRKQRQYKLTFGKPVTFPDSYWQPPYSAEGREILLEDYYSSNDSKGYVITDHNIAYSFVKGSGDKGKAQATIAVKNLSKDTIQYVLNHRDKNLYIELALGYVGELKPAYRGTVTQAYTEHNGLDVVLHLKAMDGVVNGKAVSSRTYPKGTKYATIMKDLQKDLATPSGVIVPIEDSKVTPLPVSIFGNTWQRMESFAEQFDYTMNVEKGLLNLIPKNKSLTQRVASISSATGLIGNVQEVFLRGKTSATAKDTKGKRSCRFKCQTDASLAPPLSVYLDDPVTGFKGVFKIEKAVFKCSDFETGEYTVTVDATENDEYVRASGVLL